MGRHGHEPRHEVLARMDQAMMLHDPFQFAAGVYTGCALVLLGWWWVLR